MYYLSSNDKNRLEFPFNISGQLPQRTTPPGRLPPDDSSGGLLPRRMTPDFPEDVSHPKDDSPQDDFPAEQLPPAGESFSGVELSSGGDVLRGDVLRGVILRGSCPLGELSSGGVVLPGEVEYYIICEVNVSGISRG